MQIREYEPTEEDRAGIKAITQEYPTASKMMSRAFLLMDSLSDNDKTKMELMLGFELGVRVATGTDPEVLRQVIELMDRGRAKVGNEDTGKITEMIATIVQMAASHE